METDNVFPRIESTAKSKLGKVFSDNGAAAPEAEGAYQLNTGSRKRKQKSFTLKVRNGYFPAFNCKTCGFSPYIFCLVFLAYTMQVRNILFVAE